MSHALSPEAPVSSLRDRSGTPKSSAAPSPRASPSKPQEVITIDDDDDEELPALPAAVANPTSVDSEIDLFAMPDELAEDPAYTASFDFGVPPVADHDAVPASHTGAGSGDIFDPRADAVDLEGALASLASGEALMQLDPALFDVADFDGVQPATMEEVESLLAESPAFINILSDQPASENHFLGAVGQPELTDMEKIVTSDFASDFATQPSALPPMTTAVRLRQSRQ